MPLHLVSPASQSGETPLVFAVVNNHLELATLFLSNWADVDAKDEVGAEIVPGTGKDSQQAKSCSTC